MNEKLDTGETVIGGIVGFMFLGLTFMIYKNFIQKRVASTTPRQAASMGVRG